ncbi:SDR family NAD(P)-dependent oxidoreductase [Mycobacterium sp. MUNTM1]
MGIGRAIAIALAEAGANVVVAARSEADLDETVRQIEATGQRGLAVIADVMVEDDLANLVRETLAHFGKLDILVNNAGGTQPRPAMVTSTQYPGTALHFNAVAPFVLSKLAAQAMVDTDGAGSIVNISSRSGDMAPHPARLGRRLPEHRHQPTVARRIGHRRRVGMDYLCG